MTNKVTFSIAGDKKGMAVMKILSKLKESSRHGEISQFIVDAMLEKWQREYEDSEPTKRIGGGKRRIPTDTVRMDVPKIVHEHVAELIEVNRATNNSDALLYMSHLARKGELVNTLLLEPFEKLVDEVQACVNRPEAELRLKQKYQLGDRAYDNLFAAATRHMNYRSRNPLTYKYTLDTYR